MRAAVAGLLALTAALVAAGPAAADCPPLAPSANWMERFETAFTGRAFSPEDAREFQRRENVPALIVLPTTGPAPLEVGITWLSLPVETAVRMEISPDGTGAQPWPPPWTAEQGGRRKFTYDRPGRYDLTVWLHEPNGRVTPYPTAITVSTPADFDAELVGRWETLKARLAAADLAGALECMHTDARKKYEPTFKALFVDRRTRVDDALTSIRLVEMRGTGAEYEMRRTGPRGTLSYYVRFLVDVDGVWRIQSF